MGLTEYKRKRDFKVTSEPAGKKLRSTKKIKFVIQKHAASHLHYDFRLELDGVLKSWAVPKGPSTDPSIKRLAMQVEDHPIQYGKFEGTIPKGEYGGGSVLLWDKGEWIPEGDPYQGYKAGKLKFTLKGEKLHGAWALFRVRFDEGSGKSSWLLKKEKDTYASKKDILKMRPESVKSGLLIEDIGPKRTRAKKPSVKKSK